MQELQSSLDPGDFDNITEPNDNEPWKRLIDDEPDVSPPTVAIEYEVEQVSKIKSPYWRIGGALLVMGSLCGAGAWGLSYFVATGSQQEPVAVAAQKPNAFGQQPIQCNALQKDPGCELKGHLAFDYQDNEDKKFKRSGKKTPVKSVKVPPKPVSSVPQSYSSPPSRAVTPITSIPVRSEPREQPTPQQTSYSPPMRRERVDPNARWAQIAQGSGQNFEGPEQQQTQDVAMNAPEAQNVANWNTIQGAQVTPSGVLGKTIPQYTEVSAKLKTPLSAGVPTAMLELTENIKGKDGKVIVAKGSRVTGSVSSEDGVGLAIDTIYVNDQPISLMPSSVIVSRKKANGIGRFLGNLALNTAAGVADTALSSASTTVTDSGGSRTIVSGMRRSLGNSLLGGVKGGLNSVIQDLRSPSDQDGEIRPGAKFKLVFVADTPI